MNSISLSKSDESKQEEKARSERNKCKNIRKYFKDYCEHTSIHGLKYLSEKRSIGERVLWIISITTAVVTCSYLISRIYYKYSLSPVIVSFATKESPIYTIPFPAVTVCPMSKSNRLVFNFTDVIHKKKDNVTLSPEEELNGQYMSLVCEIGTELFPDNNTFTDDFFEQLDMMRIPLEDLTFTCKFLGIDIDCSGIFTPIILDESVCYTFNMMDREEIFKDDVLHFSDYHRSFLKSNWSIDKGYPKESGSLVYPLRAFLSGADHALHVTFVQQVHDLDYLCIEDIQGVSILLHPPYSIPQVKNQYFQVPLDNAVIAVVQPKMMTTSEEVKKYEPAARECYFSTERPLKYFRIYSPSNCKFECLTNFTFAKCGCVNFYMPRTNLTPVCGNAQLGCMKDAESDLIFEELTNQINLGGSNFYCDCKPSCTDLSYDIEQSQTLWDYNEQFRARRVEAFNANKTIRLSKLSVFFKMESFLTSQRNELYGPTDFLANFGGLLGLFTGFSLLSLIEIIYFLTIRLCCNLRLYNAWTGPET